MLEELMTEEKYVDIAHRVLERVKEKIKSELIDLWYREMENWLYEQYQNVESEIEYKIVDKFSDRFIKEPELYKYEELRTKIFEEHKDKLIPVLTDDFIKANLEKQFLYHTSNKYPYNWQWKDAIAEIIIDNWKLFEKDERINEKIVRELKNRDDLIDSLRKRLTELEEND